jgi:hypothetical protein
MEPDIALALAVAVVRPVRVGHGALAEPEIEYLRRPLA